MAAFLKAARGLLPHLPAVEGGIFLQNGARLYVDTGCHPEYATPECTDPLDAVRHVLAGERIMLDVAAGVENTVPEIARVRVFKTNVDYSGSGSTWGCHESYLHSTAPEILPGQLIPHLVSRVIYTGAGGFNPFAKGLQFMLSPRAVHIEAVCSAHSTRQRPIYHSKNETLSQSGYNRLHLLCGESLCSEKAMYLKVGTTALILALVGAGQRVGDEVRLDDPLSALRAVATDATGARRLAVAEGRRLSAIEIQFHYLEMVENHLEDPHMPAWAEEVCREWRSTLEQLKLDFGAMTTLDWPIKQTLYADRMMEARTTPSEKLRSELLEVDTRFAQLGRNGVFAVLDDAGLLDHRLAGLGPVDDAVSEPPADNRARLRGAAVRRMSGREGGHVCSWEQVLDAKEARILDLTDPFETDECWRSTLDRRPRLKGFIGSLF